MRATADVPRSHVRAQRLAVIITGVFVLMLVDWVLDNPQEHLRTDWTAFDNAADRVRSGEAVYRPFDHETEPLPYLYPPYALWLSLPLAAFGFFGSYALSLVGPLIGLVAGFYWFGRAGSAEVDRRTGLVLCVASGSTVGSVLIGQYSGYYVLALGASACLYTQGRRGWAGALLAFLWLKPNLAIAVPIVLVWSRSWHTLRGFAMSSVALLAMSLPFGLSQWPGFFANVRVIAELQEQGVVPFHKMITVLGGAQETLGLSSNSPVVLAGWLVVTAVLGAATLYLWTPANLAQSPVRAFGGLALFVIAANPRVYFYDATLICLGMYGVWLHASVDGGALARRWTPRLAVVLWVTTWGAVFSGLNRFVGLLVAISLVLTAIDCRIMALRARSVSQLPQASGPPHFQAAA